MSMIIVITGHVVRKELNPVLHLVQFHGAESFVRSRQFVTNSRNFLHFMEPQGSLPCSKQPASWPNPRPDQSNPLDPIPFPYSIIFSFFFPFFSSPSLIHKITCTLETNSVFYSDLNCYVVYLLQASPNGSACFILAPHS